MIRAGIHTFFIFVFGWMLFLPAFATSQTPFFLLNDEIDGTKITSQLPVDTTRAQLPAAEIWDRLQSTNTFAEHYYGFTQVYHWVGFSIQNESDSDIWMFDVNNPHLNVVKMYVREEGGNWRLTDFTGRAAVFDSRRVSHFNFVLSVDVKSGEKGDVIIMFDKRRSSISYPITLWSIGEFNRAQQLHYTYYGIYFGIFGIVILIALSVFLTSFKLIYLWYFLYVSSVGLFVFNDIGLAHQYLYPFSATIGGAARISLTYALIITFNQFVSSYFRTRELYPGTNYLLIGLNVIVVVHGSIYVFITSWFQSNATIMLILLYSIVLISVSTALVCAARYYKIERYTAIFFILAFSFMILAGVIFIISEFGFLPKFDFLFTPIQIGSALEVVFLSFGLAWQVRVGEKEKVKLSERINRLENEKLRAYIDGTEKERTRVAMDLHDAIGNRLGQLKRNVEAKSVDDRGINQEISEIVRDIRRISHKLSPPGISIIGLTENVEQMVHDFKQSSSIDYSFQTIDVPNNLPEEMSIQLYRIVQESLQNIEKHSQATIAEIQLIGHSDQLVLTIEDNGVGMEKNSASRNGIGMGNIKKRVSFLGGSVVVSSTPGTGVQLLITIPI